MDICCFVDGECFKKSVILHCPRMFRLGNGSDVTLPSEEYCTLLPVRGEVLGINWAVGLLEV
jgi:hypothetical protein